MIDALSLVLGDRADAGVIRADQDQAEIIAQFEINSLASVNSWLTEQSLDADGDCILRRVIHREKSAKAFINGRPVTLQMMKELGEMLVDIHGQHAHQALSKRPMQLKILDEFGQLGDQAEKVTALWKTWRDMKRQYEALRESQEEREDRKALLSYQVQELDEMQLTDEELTSIESEHKRLSHLAELQATTEKQLYQLYQSDSDSLYNQLSSALAELQSMEQMDNQLTPSVELLHGAAIQIQEACQSLESYLGQLDQDPEAFHHVDQRLGSLHTLARKHRLEIDQLMEHYQALADELASLDKSSVETESLAKELEAIEAKWLKAAEKLSSSRQKAAKQLQKAVNHYLQELGMQGGKFEVDFERLGNDNAQQSGLDKITFMISANPGQPLQPLSKVASGGELSRMSLAIQVVTHNDSSIPCLIFDEVDVGIGGGTAEVVGKLLAELSQRAQVLCVTHQAQVAAKGTHHFSVAKSNTTRTTQTQITKLSGDERMEEIARMIGGIEITDQTRKFAKEMLSS